jgi:hypothetical protein
MHHPNNVVWRQCGPTEESHRCVRDLCQQGSLIYILVYEGSGSYGRGGWESGSGWRSQPLQDLRGWRPVAQG